MNTTKFNKKNVRVIAHRGLSGIEKENTNSAFVAAGNRSYYGIETDIRRTADGRFIVCHDGSLARVAGEKIAVENVSLAVSQNVILFDKDGSKDRLDLRPCTLENYIGICKKYEKHAVLELKSDFSIEETERFINIVKDFDYLDDLTFISFSYENLVKVREILPHQSVQYLLSQLDEEVISQAIAAKFDVDVQFSALTEEYVKRFHDHGLKVNCWTVDDPQDAERLAEMGVDFITSNILE